MQNLWVSVSGSLSSSERTDDSVPWQVECDGRRLELPEDIEGLLLLNINSYMGGVDLWASGASLPGQTTHAKQSFCDGHLEVSTIKMCRPDLY